MPLLLSNVNHAFPRQLYAMGTKETGKEIKVFPLLFLNLEELDIVNSETHSAKVRHAKVRMNCLRNFSAVP